MAAITGLHLLLLSFINWTTKWVPGLIVGPLGIADLYAILWLVSVVAKSMGEPSPTKATQSQSKQLRQR